MPVRTIDTNPTHNLALVQEGSGHWADEKVETKYMPLADAPPLDNPGIAQVYMGQLHYVAGHVAVGLIVHDRVINGGKAPKDGWTVWKNL